MNTKTTETNWSDEQVVIFNWFDSGKGNLVIEALAGTGKTTTIKAAFEFARESRILYAVFNKRNQKEALEKITDKRVEVKTLHALGYAYIQKVWKGVKADDAVEWDRIDRQMVACKSDADWQQVAGCVYRAMSFAKNTTVNPAHSDILRIIESEDIVCGVSYIDNNAIADCVLRSMASSKIKDGQNRISFNDMVWLPVAMDWVKPMFDLVTIDEAQDMNLPQLLMARGACNPNGRVVVVGDSRQAIYGFRGAVQNAMGMMKQQLHAETLTLTTTYRCPRLVVDRAREIVPNYNSAPSAIDGEINHVNQNEILTQAKAGDAILSRLNAPLMIHAMRLLRQGTSARIEGRDIGAQLSTLIRNFKSKTVDELLEKITKWEARECERMARKRNSEKRIEAICDQALTLNALCEGCATSDEVVRKIGNLFEDSDKTSRPAVVLSSVHKAKGLEWNRTFLLTETFSQRNQEESNIYYVALTRCKTHLFLVCENSRENELVNKKLTNECKSLNDNNLKQVIDNQQLTTKNKLPMAMPQRKSATLSTTLPKRKTSETSERIARRERRIKMLQERWAVNESEHNGKNVVVMDNIGRDTDKPTAGQVKLKVGNIIMLGGVEYYVEYVNACRARITPLQKVQVTVTDKLKDKTATFERNGSSQNIAPVIQADAVLRTISPGEMPARHGARSNQAGGTSNEGNEVMTKKNNAVHKPGKMAFVVECLTGKPAMTKSEVVKAMLEKFPGTPPQTAKNTVSWTCSSKNSPVVKQKLKFTYIEEPKADKPDKKSTAKPAKADKKPAKKNTKAAAKSPAKIPTRKPAATPKTESAAEPANAPE